MRVSRRRLLASTGSLSVAGLAGCLGLLDTRSARAPPVVENRPSAVYIPSHSEGMRMVDRSDAGDYAFAMTYSYAHRFWTVTGSKSTKQAIESDDDVHLMSVVWDPESGMVLPETGLSVELEKGGELVTEEVIYPMLSQPMGFHYGGNFPLDGDGTYTATLSVGALPIRRTGTFAERFDEPARTEIEFEYSKSDRDGIRFEDIPADREGRRAALSPMSMEMLPDSTAPRAEDLPGRVVGEATTGDAVLVVTVLDSPPEGADGEGRYLAVSARTPYNRMVIPMMGLTGTVTAGGSTAFDGTLRRTLDPDLGYHYGAAVGDVGAGDELTITVDTPPQVARHEGYETAFLDMSPVTLTL